LPKNGKKSSFLTPGGQNMQLRNKSHEIKKFHHVLKGHVQLFFFGPKAHSGGPKAQNGRNVPKKGENSTFLARSAKKFYKS
jgi:hypothetical protein